MTSSIAHQSDEGTVLRWQGAKSAVSVRCFDSPSEAGAYLAPVIGAALKRAIIARGSAIWLGCGGTTPKPIYERLIETDLEWSKVKLAQVDERFVPVDDKNSNTRMMTEALRPVLTSPAHAGMTLISLIQDMSDLSNCAVLAADKLLELGGGAPPMFDLALMGMGPDAHYASIFPHHAVNRVVYDTHDLVLPVELGRDGHEPSLPRLTLSVSAINNSRSIIFFITGQAKLDILRSASLSTDPYTSPIGAFLAQCPAPVEFVWAA